MSVPIQGEKAVLVARLYTAACNIWFQVIDQGHPFQTSNYGRVKNGIAYSKSRARLEDAPFARNTQPLVEVSAFVHSCGLGFNHAAAAVQES